MRPAPGLGLAMPSGFPAQMALRPASVRVIDLAQMGLGVLVLSPDLLEFDVLTT